MNKKFDKKLITPYVLNPKKLSKAALHFSRFRTSKGFRPLLLQSTQFDCKPFAYFNDKKSEAIASLYLEKENIKKKLSKEYVEEQIQENRNALANLEANMKKTSNDDENAEKRQIIQGEISYIKQFLEKVDELRSKGESYDALGIYGFNEMDPRYISINEKISKFEKSFTTNTPSGQCDACGVSIPSFLQTHRDFLTLDTFYLCPFCHCVEHLDEEQRGTISYLPMFSQEQINIFYHTFFILKYALEGEEVLNDNLKQYDKKLTDLETNIESLKQKKQKALEIAEKDQLPTQGIEVKYDKLINDEMNKYTESYKKMKKAFEENVNSEQSKIKKVQIVKNASQMTYGNLLEYMKKIDTYFHNQETTLVNYIESLAAYDKEKLREEYSQRIDKDIVDLNSFIQHSNIRSHFGDHDVKKIFTYNLDSPNSPMFYASFFMKHGIYMNSPLSKEEKLNILTRISGVRFLPDFESFKPQVKEWAGHQLTSELDKNLKEFLSWSVRLFELPKGIEKNTSK